MTNVGETQPIPWWGDRRLVLLHGQRYMVLEVGVEPTCSVKSAGF
jgi:hypothetical protein